MSCSDPSEAASRVEPRWGPWKAALVWDCLFFSGVARGRWVRAAVLCAHRACFSVCLGVGGTPTPSALLTTGERENQLVSCQDRRCL